MINIICLFVSALIFGTSFSQQFDNLQIVAASSSPTPVVDTAGTVYFSGNDIPLNHVIVFTALSDTIVFSAKAREINENQVRDVLVSWRLLNNTVVDNSLFPTQSTVRISAIKSVLEDTLVATYGSGATFMTDTIRFRIEPAYASNVVISNTNSTVTAGDTFRFSLHLVDARGDSVTDARRLPDSLSVYASRNQIYLTTGAILNLNNLKIPFSLNPSVVPGYVPTISGNNNKIVVSLKYPKNRLEVVSWGDTITLTVNAARAESMAVFRGGTNTVPTVDKITTFGIDIQSGQVQYDVTLFDRFRNVLDSNRSEYSSPSISRQIFGDAIDPLGFIAVRNHHVYSRTGREKGGFSRVTFVFTPLIGAPVFQSCSIQVMHVVEVVSASTHEWAADPIKRRSEVELVIDKVLGLDIDSVTPANYTDCLIQHGYSTVRDGFLDYIDITLAAPYAIKDTMITNIYFARGIDTVFWSLDDVGYNTIYPQKTRALPLDTVDSEGGSARWRVWLISHAKYPGRYSTYETSFLPVITFNNDNPNLLSTTPFLGGSDILWTIPDSIVVDSTPPVISRFSFVDNACNKDNPENSVRIEFSEPVRYYGMPPLSQNHSLFLTSDNGADSLFLATTILRENKKDLFVKIDSLEAWNYKGREDYMMMWELVIIPDSNSYFRYNHSKIRFSLDSSLTAFADIAGNIPTKSAGNELILTSERGVPPYVCDMQGLTLASIRNATVWKKEAGSNLPLFPWFGVTINMQALGMKLSRLNELDDMVSNGQRYVLLDYNTALPMITINVRIFDAIGNAVASYLSHPTLSSKITMLEIRKFLNMHEVEDRMNRMSLKELQSHFDISKARSPIDPDTLRPLYPPTINLGYDFFIKDNNRSIYPSFPLPAWNGINNRGRIVAPGGYIAKISVSVAGETKEITRKFIMNK